MCVRVCEHNIILLITRSPWYYVPVREGGVERGVKVVVVKRIPAYTKLYGICAAF